MSFTAAEVIADARLRHALFDDKVLPTPVALGLLDGYQRRLRADVMARYPEALATQVTFQLPMPDFELGFVMPPYFTILDITAFLSVMGVERGENVALIPMPQRFDSGLWPAAYVVRDGLYLKGEPSEWQGYSAVLVTYVPSDSRLTAPSALVDLPDACYAACVENLAALFGARLSDRIVPPVLQSLMDSAAASQELSLRNLTAIRRQERWAVREY
jgi:hypothetical protein